MQDCQGPAAQAAPEASCSQPHYRVPRRPAALQPGTVPRARLHDCSWQVLSVVASIPAGLHSVNGWFSLLPQPAQSVRTDNKVFIAMHLLPTLNCCLSKCAQHRCSHHIELQESELIFSKALKWVDAMRNVSLIPNKCPWGVQTWERKSGCYCKRLCKQHFQRQVYPHMHLLVEARRSVCASEPSS